MSTRYTDEQKAEAVALYVEHGLAEAHRLTKTEDRPEGIPKATLRLWAQKAGVDTAELSVRTAEKTAAATEAHTAKLAELRVKAQSEFALSAVHAARAVRGCENGKDAHGWAMASGTMLDKLRLELGEETDRIGRVPWDPELAKQVARTEGEKVAPLRVVS